MKNNKRLLSASAAFLIGSSLATAETYLISYEYSAESMYTSSQPLHPSGTPDGDNFLNPDDFGSVHNIPVTPVAGTGLLDTDTGTIELGPIDFEINITGGSYGYVGWSQTITGSFSGNVFSMTTAATVEDGDGSSVCEDTNSTACTNPNVGGEGQLPPALNPPQLYTPGASCGFGCTLDPVVTPVNQIVFDGFAEGSQGQYLFESDVEPDFTIYTIDITVGKVAYLPVPAAAWLFGTGILSLLAGKQIRRNRKIIN